MEGEDTLRQLHTNRQISIDELNQELEKAKALEGNSELENQNLRKIISELKKQLQEERAEVIILEEQLRKEYNSRSESIKEFSSSITNRLEASVTSISTDEDEEKFNPTHWSFHQSRNSTVNDNRCIPKQSENQLSLEQELKGATSVKFLLRLLELCDSPGANINSPGGRVHLGHNF